MLITLVLLAFYAGGAWSNPHKNGQEENIQKDQDLEFTNPYLWTVTLGFGAKNRIHVADDIKEGLKLGGYNDGTSGYYSSGMASPWAVTDDWAYCISIGYEINRRFGLRVMFNKGGLFESNGRRVDDETSEISYVTLDSRLTSLGLIAEYRLLPGLRVGLGPAYHLISMDFFDYDMTIPLESRIINQSNDSYSTAGVVMEVLLTVPARTRVFTFLEYKRHEIMTVDIGPYGYMETVPLGPSHSMWTWGMGFRLH